MQISPLEKKCGNPHFPRILMASPLVEQYDDRGQHQMVNMCNITEQNDGDWDSSEGVNWLVINCLLLHAAPPYATCLPDQVRLQPGDALQIQCLAHGTHPIHFTWSRVGRGTLPAGAETTKDGRLLIPNVKLTNGGTYKCVATNHLGSSEAQAKVIVRGELIFRLGQFKVHQNNWFDFLLFISLSDFVSFPLLFVLQLKPNNLHCVSSTNHLCCAYNVYHSQRRSKRQYWEMTENYI